MKIRTIPMVGVMSIVGLSLIGVGAHATFTQNSTSAEAITAGTWGITLSGSCIDGTTCPVDPSNNNNLFSLSPDGATLTFAPDTPSTSSFSTGDQEVTATSTGTIELTSPTWEVNATGGPDLVGQAYVCATSTGIGTGNTNTVLYNGPLSGFMETSYSLSSGVLSTAGPTDNFVVDVYAGDETTLCGTVFTAGPYGSATNIGVTAPGGTSAAPALTSVSAESESIAISVELTFQD
jgi:predicted ribosomally synthesized peptide with SipW-like signal peptide